MMKFLLMAIVTVASLNGTEHEWKGYQAQVLEHLREAEGWCTRDKAEKMMDLIYDVHPLVCVEIGVFGGSSIYPTAQALRYLNQGKVYAIDPWAKENCQVGYNPQDPNYIWWSSIDLEQIYRGFLRILKRYQLESFCQPMKMTSAAALGSFADASIDILHVDGNHTAKEALFDVQMWLPKVKSGGYVWFDDANWASTGLAQEYLESCCEVDWKRSVGVECLLFRKP